MSRLRVFDRAAFAAALDAMAPPSSRRRQTLVGIAVPAPLPSGDKWPATRALLAELDRESEPAPPSSRACLIAALRPAMGERGRY